MADLDSILSGEGARASEAPVVEKEIPAATEQAQAETGADSDHQPEGGEGEQGQKMVPQQALHAERQKVKRYTEEVADLRSTIAQQNTAWEQRFERLIGTLKPPAAEEPKALEPWDDGYTDSIRKPIEQSISRQREEISELLAIEKHGAEVVDAAYAAVKAHPTAGAIAQAMLKTRHPFGAMVEWHKRSQAQAEIGNDPEAYKAKLRDELKAEILAELNGGNQQRQAKPGQQAAVVMPTDLAGARNVGSRSGPAWGGPQSLTDIFDRTRKPRAA